MLNLVKKQGLGTWITLGTMLLSVIGLIIYGAALSGGMDLITANGSQPFYEATRPEDSAMMTMVVTCGILSLVFLCAAVVLGQLKFEGLVGKIVDIVVGALRVVAPALLMVTILYFVYGSFTGLGWTLFSNEELEINPEAVAVAHTVITGIVFLVIAAIASIVAVFFGINKKQKLEEAKAE